MKQPTAPCRYCDKRTMTCHIVCRGYKEYQKEQEVYSAFVKEDRQKYAITPSASQAFTRLLRKKQGRK